MDAMEKAMKTKTKIKHTPTPWYLVLVANTPGVDIRHKLDGQELTLIENVNFRIAKKVVRAVNSHEDMLDALKRAKRVVAESCGYNDGVRFHTDLLNDIEAVLAQAEGK